MTDPPDPARAARLTALWNQVARAEDEAIGDHLSVGSFSHLLNPLLFQLEQAEQARDTAHVALIKVRAHTSYAPAVTFKVVAGLLASIERIVDAALQPAPAQETERGRSE